MDVAVCILGLGFVGLRWTATNEVGEAPQEGLAAAQHQGQAEGRGGGGGGVPWWRGQPSGSLAC